jgi:hypothetical protein
MFASSTFCTVEPSYVQSARNARRLQRERDRRLAAAFVAKIVPV